MNWQEVCDDPLLRELPYKLELDEWGHIVMSPATNRHGLLQGLIQAALRDIREDGLIFPECPIQTAKGVKVPDVVWASAAFLDEYAACSPFPRAPELCIEILPPAHSPGEMDAKRELYFARGAQEVWLCDERGALGFHDCTGPIPTSRLFPGIGRIESAYLH